VLRRSKARAVAAPSLTRLCSASNCAMPSESSQTTSASTIALLLMLAASPRQ
jgi:hypothetical protein